MRGLMIKDFYLLAERKTSLVLFVAIAFMMGMTVDGTFIVAYCTMLGTILVVSTLSYDSHDNGYVFLMTLPITRKDYVTEKYIFCVLGAAMGWIFSIIIYIIIGVILSNRPDLAAELPELLVYLPLFTLVCSIMIPIELKFGAEKSRVALAILGGGIFVLGMLGKKYLPENLINSEMISGLDQMPLAVFAGILAAAAVAGILISYVISLQIMKKKEF